MAINFDSSLYASAVGQWLAENFEPQFARNRAVFAKLQSDGAIKVGGAYLLAPVTKDKNPSVQGVTNFAAAMSIPADQGLGAQYNWSWYEGLTAINKAEEMASEGEAAMVDLLESRLSDTVATFVEVVNTDLFSTTDASQSKIAGLPYAMDTTGSFGGIDRATNTWWQANNEATVGTITLAKMNRMYNTCQSKGGTPPSLIIMPSDIFGSYESLIQASQRFCAGCEACGVRIHRLPAQRRDSAVRRRLPCGSGAVYQHPSHLPCGNEPSARCGSGAISGPSGKGLPSHVGDCAREQAIERERQTVRRDCIKWHLASPDTTGAIVHCSIGRASAGCR